MRHAVRLLIGAISAIAIALSAAPARTVAPAMPPPRTAAFELFPSGDPGHRRCPAYLATHPFPGNAFLPTEVGGLAIVHRTCEERGPAPVARLSHAMISPALAAMFEFIPTWTLPLSDDLQSVLLAGGFIVNEALTPSIWQVSFAHLFLSAPLSQLHILPGLR